MTFSPQVITLITKVTNRGYRIFLLRVSIYRRKSTILNLGIKEYLRKFYSFFFVRKIFILLSYLSRRKKIMDGSYNIKYFSSFFLWKKKKIDIFSFYSLEWERGFSDFLLLLISSRRIKNIFFFFILRRGGAF